MKIGIDISQNSTGICINRNGNNKYISFVNAKKASKFQKNMELYTDIHYYEKSISSEQHSEQQKIDMLDYMKLSLNILNVIRKEIDIPSNKVTFCIEDYSLGSSKRNNYLTQLVSLSSAIRMRLLDQFLTSEFIFNPPKTIKKTVACLVYGLNYSKDKLCRNKDGVAGGKFDKKNMLQAFIDYSKPDDPLYQFIKEYEDSIVSKKTINAPLPDLIDAFWNQEIIDNENLNLKDYASE